MRQFSWMHKSLIGAAMALLLGGQTIAAPACMICIGLPEKNDADYLVQANCVVLARVSTKDPFAFTAHETLKGHYDGTAIDLFVDSTTRRILQANPDRWAILFTDQQSGKWRSLGVVSESYISMARRIIFLFSNSPGGAISQKRCEFFIPLLGHSDSRINELAYLEMSRAPYSVIKKISKIISRDAWMPKLTDPRYLEWRSLAILLLAQSEEPQDKKRILESFRSAHRFRLTTNLAAWAAAAIEVEPQSTVKFIEDNYFRRAESSTTELKSIIMAMSMHGQQSRKLQDQIVESYRVLLLQHPQLAGPVANDLHNWKRSELVDRLSAIRINESGFDVADRQKIERYLRAIASPEDSALAHE